MVNKRETGCCSCSFQFSPDSSCCAANTGEGGQERFLEVQPKIPDGEDEKRLLNIQYMYLDLFLCERCRETEKNLNEAVEELSGILGSTGIELKIEKIHVQKEEQARQLGFISSPTIRINGYDLQPEVEESLCQCCSQLCDEDVDCRIWTYAGRVYDVPPKPMIIEAILKEAYCNRGESLAQKSLPANIPENLQRFFRSRRRQ